VSEPQRRRLPIRWLSLAEIVGVLALVVAALGWWDNHRERAQQDRERAIADQSRAAEAHREAARATFLLTGAAEASGDRIRLSSVHPDQVVQTQALVFPSAIRRDPVETTGNPRIEAGWFEEGLKRAGRDRPEPKGEERRVPVGIVTTYVEAGDMQTDRAIYVVAGRLKGRLLRGSKLELDGVSLVRRGVAGDLQAAVDAAWARGR
jgi:hypothetical protein